jgi:hypothetical protein
MTISTTSHRPAPPPGRATTQRAGVRSRSWPDQVTPYSQGALALNFPLPSGLDCEPRTSALTLVQPSPSGRRPARADSHAWAARFMQAVIEVLSSERPLTQLIRWTDANVYADIASRRQRLAERSARVPRSGRPPVATVHVYQPAESVTEVAARVTTGNRSRAVAARLERRNDRWLCTAIQFG